MKTIRWIKDVLRKKILYVGIILIIQVVLNIGSVAYALVFKGVTDAAVSGSVLRLRNWVLAFVALVLIQTTLGAVNRYFSELSRASIENVFKLRLYTATMNRKYECVTGIHSGEWMNRFTSDTAVVAEGVTQIIPGAVSMLVRMLCALVLLIHFCPVFGYIIIPAGVIFLGLSATFRKVLKRRHKQVQEADGRLRVYLQESLSALLVVKAFSKEKDMLANAKQKMTEHKDARMKKNYFSNFCNTGFVAVMNVSYIIGTAIGGYGIISDRMTYGTLIAIVQLIGQIQAPLSNITGYLPQFYSMLASAERLKEIEQYDMDIASENIMSQEEIRRIYKEEFCYIEFRNVAFSYNNVLKDKCSEYEDFPVFEHLNVIVKPDDLYILSG